MVVLLIVLVVKMMIHSYSSIMCCHLCKIRSESPKRQRGRWREGEKNVKRINTDISTQLKDELQVTMLVLIYEQLLPSLLLVCLLERVDGLFPSLLADYKDLDVGNNLVLHQAYLPQLESG